MEWVEDLDSSTAKLVAMYLDRAGNATPDRIAERLQLPLMTILSTLRNLDDAGVVRYLDDTDRVVLADRLPDADDAAEWAVEDAP
ncbi:MAG: hypothetical protein ABEJ82_06570 [Haloplanus sp.]